MEGKLVRKCGEEHLGITTSGVALFEKEASAKTTIILESLT
jgi:hypothetical protein